MTTPTQMPESLKVPEELAAIQQALDDFPGGWHTVFDEVRERQPGIVELGALWEDSDDLAEVITVDTGNYYDTMSAMPMAQFIAACKPATLKAVLSHISALQSALKDRDAEIERLKKDAERSADWCSEVRQDREMVASALQALLKDPLNPETTEMAHLALGEHING